MESLDQYIARYITVKTPREIADLAGVTAEEVIQRAREMRDEIDALSLEENISFLMMRLNRIAADAENDARNASNTKDKGGLYSAAVGAIRETLKQINTLKKENNQAVAELNQRRLAEILRLFDVIVAKGVKEISETYDIEQDDLTAVFQGKIIEAARELDAA